MRGTIAKLVVVAVAVGAAVSIAPSQQSAPNEPGFVTVTVVGKGLDKVEALLDARRKAVQYGAGMRIHAFSKTRDFVLIRDTILTRSSGYLQGFEVLDISRAFDGVWTAKIKAIVSVRAIGDAWAAATDLIQQMGRPKVMVFIIEEVRTPGAPAEVAEVSTVQTCIEQMLLAGGFILVDKKQVTAIDARDLRAAIAANKPAVAQAIGKRLGAQLIVTGTANATANEGKVIADRWFFSFEGVANVRGSRTDTGQVFASIPSVAGLDTRGLQRAPNSAAQQAFNGVGSQITPKLRTKILEFWQDALAGRGEVVLEIENIKFLQYVKVKRALAGVQGVKDINGTFHNSTARLSIQSETRAEKLAERMAVAMEQSLEITDVSQNVVKATYLSVSPK